MAKRPRAVQIDCKHLRRCAIEGAGVQLVHNPAQPTPPAADPHVTLGERETIERLQVRHSSPGEKSSQSGGGIRLAGLQDGRIYRSGQKLFAREKRGVDVSGTDLVQDTQKRIPVEFAGCLVRPNDERKFDKSYK